MNDLTDVKDALGIMLIVVSNLLDKIQNSVSLNESRIPSTFRFTQSLRDNKSDNLNEIAALDAEKRNLESDSQ